MAQNIGESAKLFSFALVDRQVTGDQYILYFVVMFTETKAT